MWIRYKCTLLAKHFARNLFCADGMIKEIWAMDQTLSRHYSRIPAWMLAPKHHQEQSVHLSNTLQSERGRGREKVQKDLWINALRRELNLRSLEHLVWTASRKCKWSYALALCTECHFSRTRTKQTQTAAVCTTVCGNHAFCTCSLLSCGAVAFASCKQNWHPLWKIYEAKMQTTQHSISRETNPPSASKVTCLQVCPGQAWNFTCENR